MSRFDIDFHWTGRTDSEDGEAGYRWHQKVIKADEHPDKTGIALLGFACDVGVVNNKGRPGAKAGPDAIRQALANFAWHQKCHVIDAGTVTANEPQDNDDTLEQTQSDYANRLTELLKQHSFVLGLGGGHEIAWGSYNGLLNCLNDKNKVIGILNFDAHFDLRKPAPLNSSGTPFYQIALQCESKQCKSQKRAFKYACLGIAETANTQALFSMADHYRVRYQKDIECELSTSKALLTDFLQGIDELYVTICLDVFSASVAPGVSAPAALGISPGYVIQLLHWLAEQQQPLNFHWRLADIAEMNPRFDVDGQTAKLAARLVYELSKLNA